MRKTLLIASLFFCQPLVAQKYVGEAALPAIPLDGFYKIRLTPDVVSCLTPGFANVRITDNLGHEVPYFVVEESPVFSTTSFREYKMDKQLTPGCCTTLILHNPGQAPINNISLLIRNAETIKAASLLGSDDQKQWYALKEKFQLYGIDNKDQTSEVRIVDFPLSNYSWYKLTINDSTSAPLNILKSGYYDVSTGRGRYTEISKVKFSVGESPAEKRTYVMIKLDTTGLVDMMEMELNGPPFYHRRAELYVKRWIVDKKKDSIETNDFLESFDLSSRQASAVRMGSVRGRELLLIIDNGDNPVLNVKSIRLYQLNRYLVAYLSKTDTYQVKVGEETLATPVYDIGYFRDSIPSDPPQLAAGTLVLKDKDKPAESFTLFTSRNIIWVAIIGVIVLLGYMSRSMMARMKQQ